MSDAPRSSDSGKPSELDSPPRHTELDDRGDRPLEGAPNEVNPTASPTPRPPPLPRAGHLNGAGSLPSASETGHADAQPMPDASFSSDAPMPALPQPVDAVEPEGADAHGSSQPQAEPPVAAEPPVNVSPILSALDAAEPRVEPPPLGDARSRRESRPRIELPPERRLFGSYSTAPPPIPKNWPTDIDELSPPELTSTGSSQGQELSSSSGMMREKHEDLHYAGETPLPVGPAADALDAAARIAAEASAAAEALESLQRLLGNRAPNVEATTSPVVTAPPPPPIERHEPAVVSPPIVPRPMPPPMPLPNRRAMVPTDALPIDFERDRKIGVVLRGFLAGLGLSLAAGAVLYFFMTAG